MAYDLFFDGFEDYGSYADLNKYGYSTADSWGDQLVSILPTGGRRSGACAKISTRFSGGLKFSIPASTHVVVGVALKSLRESGDIDTSNAVIVLSGGGVDHAIMVIPEAAIMTLYAAGIQVAQSTASLPRDTWCYFELGFSVANIGGTYELRCNGTSQDYIPPGTGDTQTGTSTTIDQISIIGNGVQGTHPNIYVDDLYVTYGDELVWRGDSRVDRMLLTADSTPQDWTPSTGNAWERLNAGDGYIASAVDEATGLFAAADIGHQPDIVYGVCVRSLMLKSDAGTRESALLIKSDTTESESESHALTETSAGYVHILKTDPATSAAWTASAVNAVKPGLRVKA